MPLDNECTRIMQALLDIEWKQAAEGFALNAGGAQWGRVIAAMKARQHWANKASSMGDREMYASALMESKVVGQWVPTMAAEWDQSAEAADVSVRVRARHLPKTGKTRG